MTLAKLPLQAILFDMDGVIADTREAHKHSWGIFMKNAGFDMDMDEWMRFSFGRGNREILSELFGDSGHSAEFLAAKALEKEEIFRDLFRRGEAPTVPGLHDFIATCKRRGIALAVGSSAPRGNIDVILAELGITQEFAVIIGNEDVTRAKPDPEIFLRCCRELGTDPARSLVLEDSLHGLEAARRAGSPAIGIATMHSHEELRPHCDGVADDFHGVTRLLGF